MPRPETEKHIEEYKEFFRVMSHDATPCPESAIIVGLIGVLQPFLYILADIADSLNAMAQDERR